MSQARVLLCRPEVAVSTFLALAFVAGLLAGPAAPDLARPALLALCLSVGAIPIVARRGRPLRVALVAAAAASLAGLAAASPPRWKPVAWKRADHVVVGVLERRLELDDGNDRLLLTVEAAAVAGEPIGRLRPCRQRVALTARGGFPEGLGPGDRVLLRAGRIERRRRANFGDEALLPGLPAGVVVAGPLLVASAPPRRALVEAVRRRVRDGLARGLGPRALGLARALVLGERDAVDERTTEAFRITGTSHLLAVSGLHLAIVTGLVLLAGRALALRSPLARRGRPWVLPSLAAGLAAWAYAVLTGLAPPVFRAAVMASAALAASVAGRPGSTARAVLLAAAVLLAWDPSLARAAGFQLSFAAVLALWLLPRASNARAPAPLARRLARTLLSLAAASAAATVVTGPLVAHHFGRVSPAGLVVNVLAVPAMSLVVLPATVLLAVASALDPRLGGWLGPAVGPVLETLVAGLETASSVPGASLAVPRPTLPEALALSAAALTVVARGRRGLVAALALAVLSSTALVVRLEWPRLTATMRVTFLDVGAGDATVVDLPRGGRILVDSGPSRGRPGRPPAVVEALERRGLGPPAVFMLSHGHEDHVGGAGAVLRRTGARELWPGPGVPSSVWSVQGGRAPPRIVDAASLCGRRRLGGVELEVLHPCGSVPPGLGENDLSLVLRLRYRGVSVLLPGDIEAAGEEALLAGGASLEADVLELAHHGSRTSSAQALLDRVRPRVAVASCASSPARPLPHPEVADRLRRMGVVLLSTAEHGAVELSTDGAALAVRTVRVGRVRLPAHRRSDESGTVGATVLYSGGRRSP